MFELFRSATLGTSGLSALLVMAGMIVYARPIDRNKLASDTNFFATTLVAVAWQCLHFTEEYVTEFYVLFPLRFGLLEWPSAFFVVFNLTWIAIWCLSAAALPGGRRLALVPIWFLALASMANAVVHPLLAIERGAYFPGVWTSPLSGLIGVLLFRALLRLQKQ